MSFLDKFLNAVRLNDDYDDDDEFFDDEDDLEEEESESPAMEEKKPKKSRFQFFKDVKAEMKRVTWPTRKDVIRWSGVVVGALVFFGVYVAILDNVIVTPALVALSGLGA